MADRDDLLRRGCVCVLICLLVTALAGAGLPARAASLSAPIFMVNSTSDAVASPPLDSGSCETAPSNGICTLRAAIMKANHWPGGGATITFDPQLSGQPIVLTIPADGTDDETTGDLNITSTVTIIGSGAGKTIIDANGSHTHSRVLNLGIGVALTLTGVTIQGGQSASGGGISSLGLLRLSGSVITGNQASGSGGGLAINMGQAIVYSSTVSANHASYGGGLYVFDTSMVTLVNTTVSANTAINSGGGLRVSLSLGIKLVNSTLSGNVAGVDGGGLWVGGLGDVRLFNATIANNLADDSLSGSGAGGGIFNDAGGGNTVELQNSLLARNFVKQSLGQFQILVPDDCNGTLTSLDYNLVSNTTGCTLAGGASHDQTGIPANLGPLQDNGGPTWTHALLPGSLAIDAGNPGGCKDPADATLATDQRGLPRTANGAGATVCDIGAYELQRTLDLPLVLK